VEDNRRPDLSAGHSPGPALRPMRSRRPASSRSATICGFRRPITKMARECRRQWRRDHRGGSAFRGASLPVPPARRSSIQVPIRVAVVQGGVSEKKPSPPRPTRPPFNLAESGSEPFTMVAEDLAYPAPPGALGDSYIFYCRL